HVKHFGHTGVMDPLKSVALIKPLYPPEENQCHRTRTGLQGDAPIRFRPQPEEVPEIRTESGEKRDGATCFGGIGEKYLSIAVRPFLKASEFGSRLLLRQEKSPVKGLIFICYTADQRLV